MVIRYTIQRVSKTIRHFDYRAIVIVPLKLSAGCSIFTDAGNALKKPVGFWTPDQAASVSMRKYFSTRNQPSIYPTIVIIIFLTMKNRGFHYRTPDLLALQRVLALQFSKMHYFQNLRDPVSNVSQLSSCQKAIIWVWCFVRFGSIFECV